MLRRRIVLHAFVVAHRGEIIARCRAKVASRPAPRPTDVEILYGVPLFLDQLAATLRDGAGPEVTRGAVEHARELRSGGFTVAQVVHDYGNICQTITELAVELKAPMTAADFQTLNLTLDEAIAGAVTEYGRLRETEDTERLGRLSHELRDLLHRASLAFDAIRSGDVGVAGATADLLGRSLGGLRTLIDRELAEVRLTAGLHHDSSFRVRDLLEDVEVSAAMEARARGQRFALTMAMDPDARLRADRQTVESILGNLLQNAFKFTRSGGIVSLHAHARQSRSLFEIHDQCGGLPAGAVETFFRPFEQRSRDRSGLGLGLDIAHRGAIANGGEIRVVDQPGEGCIFTLDLPLAAPATT